MKISGSLLAVVLFVLAFASPAAASDPTFERAFGVGVNGGTGFENCTAAPSCVAGVSSGVAGGLNENSDVLFDPHGGMFVVDYGNNRIERFLVNPDGSVSFDRTFGWGVQNGAPAAFQNCVSDCQSGSSTDGGGALNGPWKLAFDNAGRLLVSEYNNDRISRFLIAPDGTATFDRAFGWEVNTDSPGGGLETCTAGHCQKGQDGSGAAGELRGPDGIAVDSSGGIYVGEYSRNRISRFTVADGGTPTFDRSFGLDVDPGGGTGFENCSLATGCQAGTTGPGDAAAGSGAQNYEIHIAPDGRIFAAGYSLNRIDVFTRAADGTVNFQQAFGEDVVPLDASAGFQTCSTTSRCQAGFDSGIAGSINLAIGFDFDPAGGLFVMAEGDNRFNHFVPANGDGFAFDYAYGFGVAGGTGPETCRATCVKGQQGAQGGAFNVPGGVHMDPEGKNVYVSDFANNRIQKFAVGPNVTVTAASTPASDTGRFDLKVGNTVVKTGAANGESGTARTGIGSVTVSETAASGTLSSNYISTIDCGSGPVAGTSLVVPNVSTDLNCVVSNVRKPVAFSKFSKVVLKPKNKKVKAGKKVRLKVSVTNTGNTTGTATVKLTSSSKKKATVPKTLKVKVGSGKTVTKKFTVKTKKKKSGKVKITAKVGSKAAKTVLRLKK